jgi:antibiotic biosynthesis monooxygenase (ABM) superfamily enzyme
VADITTTAIEGGTMQPPRWKLAVLTWVGIYPLITVLLWVLGPVIRGIPLPLVTLGLTIPLVSVMTFVVMPTLTKAFGGWLRRDPTARSGLVAG